MNLLLCIPKALRELNPATADAEAREAAARNDLRNRLPHPPAHPPTDHERRARAIHEAAHGVAAFIGGSTAIELLLRPDATGQCVINPLAKAEDKITFALAGIVAEARFSPRSIHRYTDGDSYDLRVARLLIDGVNAPGNRLPLSYTAATKAAIKFCDGHWTAIENVAVALDDAGAVDDFAVRIFATCRP